MRNFSESRRGFNVRFLPSSYAIIVVFCSKDLQVVQEKGKCFNEKHNFYKHSYVHVLLSQCRSPSELETPAITCHSSRLVVPFLFAPGCATQCIMLAGHFHGKDGKASTGV